MSTSGSRSGIVLELAEEFLERYRKGQRPPLKEYIDRHPELAEEIREVFPAMAMMEKIALADESMAGDSTGPARLRWAPPPEQLGDFRILREIGRGGMGVVYEAEQVSLGRNVALKLLPPQKLQDANHKRRFEREARAAARLHHTNIVPVFGVGEHEDTPYYVMQFIQGLGLDEVLDELKRLRAGADAPAPTVTARGRRASHRDVSAADVARSLLTGRFETAGIGEDPGPNGASVGTATIDSPPRTEAEPASPPTRGLTVSLLLVGLAGGPGPER
jgi:Protein kinase domain